MILIIFSIVFTQLAEEHKKTYIIKPKWFPAEIVKERKSTKKAVALSLFLPGLGEHYLGFESHAIRGYAIEASIWVSFLGLRWYADRIFNDYILYAYEYAGAKKGQDKKYYEIVEWYKDIESYNTHIREEARAIFSDRDSQLEYIKEHSLPEELAWEWIDETQWNEYRNLRLKERKALHYTSYLVGFALLNRAISAIISANLPTHKVKLGIKPTGVEIYFSFNL